MKRLALALLLSSSASLAWGEDVVTPYRPTVSNPAALSAPGWVELEVGVVQQKGGDNASASALPYQLKFALSEDFGVLLGGNTLVQQTAWDASRLSGMGDTTLLLKNRWAWTDDTALGLEYGFKSPTASAGLGSGKTDYVLNGIYSWTGEKDALDLNLNVTKLGNVQPGQGGQQWGWAASWCRQLDARWAFSSELSGTVLRGTAPAQQVLVAASYMLNNRTVLDAGVASGLHKSAQGWSMFAGVSVLLERLR